MSLTALAQEKQAVIRTLDVRNARTIGHYRVLTELGRKHATAVYKAMDLQHDRLVALKVILAAGLPDERLHSFREGLRREASIAARLTHPGIVPILDTAEDPDGNPYIVMEFVEGETLEQALETRKYGSSLTFGERLDIAIEIARMLDHMHSRGVVHRDIKPSNILLTKQFHVRIVDFGIATLIQEEHRAGAVLPGTPAFVAPELWNDSPASARSDIFSLGVLLYWMFTAEIPFSGGTVTEIMHNVANSDPLPVRWHNWALSDELDGVLGKCLAKNPGERYVTARELERELAILRHDMAPSTTPPRGNGVSGGAAGRPALTRGGFPKPDPVLQSSALASHQRALAAEPSPRTAVSQNVPGSPAGRSYSNAIRACRAALSTAQDRFGAHHPNVADIVGQLALLCHKKGLLAEAEELHKRALRSRELAFGGGHPKVATTLNNLALLYRDQGRLAEAQNCLERSLEIAEKHFGHLHPKTALRLSNLAALLYLQRQYDHAERFYRRLIDMLGNAQAGIPRGEIVQGLQNYVALLRTAKRTEEADRVGALIQNRKIPNKVVEEFGGAGRIRTGA